MFYFLDLKKLRVPLTAALLFFILTAIIIIRGQSRAIADEVFDREHDSSYVLIIDPGHGGADGGAVSQDGMTESSVNLAIAHKLNTLCRLFGTEAIMTRCEEALAYPDDAESIRQKKVWDQNARVELTNSTDNAVLISIHQNTYPDPRPSGAQVLYSDMPASKELGELTHSNLISQLDPQNRRVAAPVSGDIYLMRSVNCPAILVECGFLSNSADAAKLADGAYRTKIALILFASYIQFTEVPHDTAAELTV